MGGGGPSIFASSSSSNTMKLSFLKSKQKSARGKKRTGDIAPVRDWLYALSAATLVFLIGIGCIAYDFRVQFVLPPETGVATSSVQYSEREVTRFAEQYDAKDARFNALRSALPQIAPPATPPSETEDTPVAPQEGGEYTTPTPSL